MRGVAAGVDHRHPRSRPPQPAGDRTPPGALAKLLGFAAGTLTDLVVA
jgi:hypothetical protein